jgi:diguanylate cyclase (GGDEF)-like protein
MATNVAFGFQMEDEMFMSDLGIAVSRENQVLFSIIQKGLDAIPENEVHSIRSNWFRESQARKGKRSLTFTEEEREYLSEKKTVRFCISSSLEPMELSENGWNHGGIFSDFIDEISQRIPVNIERVIVETPEEALLNAREGRCEVVPFLEETNGASETFKFTTPYFDFPIVVVTRNDLGFINGYLDLQGQKIALVAGSFLVKHLSENQPDIEFITVPRPADAFQMVSEKKAYAALACLPVAVSGIGELELENLKISGSVPQKNRARLGVVKGEKILYRVLEKGINSITEKEKDNIFRGRFDVRIDGRLERTFLIRSGLAVILIAAFLLWRQRILYHHNNQLRELNGELNKLSVTDHLTSLYNRFYTDRMLSQEVERIKRYHGPLSAVYLDIDFFKRINDQFGHMKGDEVLKQIADILRKNARSVDIVGRWGGEEFILFLPETAIARAEKFAEKIRKIISETDFGTGDSVTASFGVCQYSEQETPDQFILRLDKCLYQAKEEGRNRVIACSVEKSSA